MYFVHCPTPLTSFSYFSHIWSLILARNCYILPFSVTNKNLGAWITFPIHSTAISYLSCHLHCPPWRCSPQLVPISFPSSCYRHSSIVHFLSTMLSALVILPVFAVPPVFSMLPVIAMLSVLALLPVFAQCP